MAGINATAATAAYRAGLDLGRPTEADAPATAPSFSSTLQRALEGVVETGKTAEAASTQAVLGSGDVTGVVTAIAKAELAMQATVAVRDRLISAYQEVMRMPI